MFRLTTAVLCLIGLFVAQPIRQKHHPQVTISAGMLEGSFSMDHREIMFLGIPYAQPPTGPLRWKPPAPVKPWVGTRNANSFASSCPQDAERAAYYAAATREYSESLPYYNGFKTNEDCLYLNIWTTNLGGTKKAPVMVWIHGGGNVEGTGELPAMGPAVARSGIVFVSINYRLGMLGFLAHPALTAESSYHSAGNYALLDQIAALKWVKDNIGKFGGAPENVTVIGESAGAVDTCYLMTSPLARGLFQRAIIQSNGCADYLIPDLKSARDIAGMKESGEEAGVRFAKKVVIDGADILAKLRALSVEEILGASDTSSALETVDGWVLPEQPAIGFANERQIRIPSIIGSNADEGSMFADEPSGPASVEQYRAWLKKEFGAEWQAVEKGYAARNDSEVKTAFLAVVTDHEFGSSTYIMARAMKRIGQRVYFYHFTYPAKSKNARLGAYHGLELSFLAGMARKSSWGEFGPADEALSQTMRAYWTEFANTSDPNKSGLPPWPEYEGTKETCLEIGRHVRSLPVPHRERYRVFQEILKTKLAALAARDN